jgi:hypothetical protein
MWYQGRSIEKFLIWQALNKNGKLHCTTLNKWQRMNPDDKKLAMCRYKDPMHWMWVAHEMANNHVLRNPCRQTGNNIWFCFKILVNQADKPIINCK